jgi:hypothetical protein
MVVAVDPEKLWGYILSVMLTLLVLGACAGLAFALYRRYSGIGTLASIVCAAAGAILSVIAYNSLSLPSLLHFVIGYETPFEIAGSAALIFLSDLIGKKA